MMHRLWAILMFAATLASGQDAQPTMRVEVKSSDAAIQDAEVTADRHSGQTGPDGVVILPAALGRLEIRVAKEGFFPARTTLDIDSAKEWAVQIELQPQEEREEKVTVY